MTETELTDRLAQELATGPAWRDVQKVETRPTNPTLAGNELFVHFSEMPSSKAISTFRLVAEPLNA